jgi:nitroreductase
MTIDDVRTIVAAAVRAPSVHNTQPWKFAAGTNPPDEPGAIDVFGDRERLLGVIDPDGRELHISCGAAIELAHIRARSLGLSCAVHLLPEPANPDHFARIEIGAPEPATPREVVLGEAVASRYTERGRFEDRPVPAEVVEELRRVASSKGAWIRILDQPGDEVTTAVLLSHADDLERANPAYERELAAWTRAEERSADDGVPTSALPSTPASERGSSYRLREFDSAELNQDRPYSREEPPTPEHPFVLLLGTPGDDPRSWLEAGSALARLLVTAAEEGIAASPMTQVLEIPATREMLARELGLVGHPQILLRLGYGHGHASSPRRPVDEVLTT